MLEIRPTSPNPPVHPSDEERQLIRDSVRGFLGEHWPSETAVARSADAAARAAIWQGLAGQGLAALGMQPDDGGLREILVVMEELGRAACPAPMADVAVLNLLLRGATLDARAAEFLSALQDGRGQVCLSFAGSDPDNGAGAVTFADGRVNGQVDFVDGALSASHVVLFVDAGARLAVVGAKEGGLKLTPTRALGSEGLCQLSFSNAAAWSIPLDAGQVPDAIAIARLAYAAQAWGAADRAFELVVDYVKQRRQFGQPVGRFQAIQHKLANNLIALTGIHLALDQAAEQFDRGVASWRAVTASAWAFATSALRQVSLETHHAFGAIGYAEDHEAPRHFRCVHLNMVRLGGGRAGRDELADRYLGPRAQSFPEYDIGEAGNALRQEVRAWLAEHWPAARREAYEATDPTHREYDAAFARELGKTGWLGLSWPKKFGGMERSAYEMLAFIEEMERAEAPRAGAPIQAAAWMIHGTPEQQAEYLPDLLRGQATYGMWYSEPDSGSDLASIRTTAVRDGDDWVINGQKIWTTTYWADYMWLAVRTQVDAKPAHAGISMFVVRSDTPGITRRPMRTMYDGEFCNTFLDNVRVPASALVGELNGGWQVLTGSLGTERAYVGSRILLKLARHFEELCDHIRTLEVNGQALRLDPLVRDAIGGLAADIEIGRHLSQNSINLYAKGVEPTWEAAMAKVYAGELMERFGEKALDLLGMRATLSSGSDGAPLRGRIEQRLRHSLMWVISLGTNEVQRSLIAQRGLGLPR